VPRSRKSGYAPVGMTKWRAVAHLGMSRGWMDRASLPKSPHYPKANLDKYGCGLYE
jgi:hypothetical protein